MLTDTQLSIKVEGMKEPGEGITNDMRSLF